jgi:hypothetical protein
VTWRLCAKKSGGHGTGVAFEFVRERVYPVVDLYDAMNPEVGGNYYTPKQPLNAENKIGPPMP